MRILTYGDSPAVNTGLGIVARHAIRGLLAAGHEPVAFGMNHWVPYVNPVVHPYPIHAAGINPEGDAFGRASFLRLARKVAPDVVLSLTDLQVTATWLPALREFYDGPVVVYAPVDCPLLKVDLRGLETADKVATYTKYGAAQLARLGVEARVIPLGVDSDAFRPLGASKEELKGKYFDRPDAFVVMAVARNQWRKDLARTMMAFRILKSERKDALLYLHSRIDDVGGDLRYQAMSVGLDLERDVVFAPREFSEIVGVDVAQLNELYNAADVVVSTALGEGWGMSATEAFAAGTPFVGPRHTSFVELVGPREERGYLARVSGWQVCYGFDCHVRPVVDEAEVARKILLVSESPEETRGKTERALEWARSLTWERMGSEISRLVEEAANEREG